MGTNDIFIKIARTVPLPQKSGALIIALATTILGIGAAGKFHWGSLLFILFTYFVLSAEGPALALLGGRKSRPDNEPAGSLPPPWKKRHALWLAVYLGMGFLCGTGVLLSIQPHPVALATLITLAILFIAIYLAFARRRQERHVVAQISSIMALSLMAPANYYVATGLFNLQVMTLWLLCTIFFVGSIPYVKMRTKSLEYKTVVLVYHLASFFAIVALAMLEVVAPQSYLGFIPVTLKAVIGSLLQQTARRISTVGIVETIVTGLFIVLTLVAYAG